MIIPFITHTRIVSPAQGRFWVKRVWVKLTKKTTLYWWPNPMHRHFDPCTGRPAFFSVAWRRDCGGGVRCSWVEIWIFELRTVHHS